MGESPSGAWVRESLGSLMGLVVLRFVFIVGVPISENTFW
jgi:hypothetical protein